MVPFELLLVSAFVVTSSAIPTNKPLDHYRGVSAAQYHLTAGFQRSSNKYQCLEGGATAYPPTSTWLPFDALWNINQPIVLSSNGGDTYIEHYVHEAIIEASKKRKHDERLILAVVMQVVCQLTTLTRDSTLTQAIFPVKWQSHGTMLRPFASEMRQDIRSFTSEGFPYADDRRGFAHGGANGLLDDFLRSLCATPGVSC